MRSTKTTEATDFVAYIKDVLVSDLAANKFAATKVEFFDDADNGVIVTNSLGRWAISVERQDW